MGKQIERQLRKYGFDGKVIKRILKLYDSTEAVTNHNLPNRASTEETDPPL